MTHRDLIEKGRADHIDVSRCGDPAGEEVDGVGPVGFVKALGVVSKVELVPKVAPGNAGVFELGEGGFLSVDVMDGEKGGDKSRDDCNVSLICF